MIPTCKLCGIALPLRDGFTQPCPFDHHLGLDPSHPDVRRANPGQDLGAASRDPKPCCKRIRTARGYGFCQLQDGHDRGLDPQPCVTEFISEDLLPEEFGPTAGKRRRW